MEMNSRNILTMNNRELHALRTAMNYYINNRHADRESTVGTLEKMRDVIEGRIGQGGTD